MTDTTAELLRRLQALEDAAAIEALKIRYWRGIDQKCPEVVRECLAPEVHLDMEGVPCETRDEYIPFIEQAGCRPGLFNLHAGQNPLIELTGADTAHGSWDVLFTSIDLSSRAVIRMTCAYNDRYLRRHGRWWIVSMQVRQTSFLMQEISSEGAVKTLSMGQSNASAFEP